MNASGPKYCGPQLHQAVCKNNWFDPTSEFCCSGNLPVQKVAQGPYSGCTGSITRTLRQRRGLKRSGSKTSAAYASPRFAGNPTENCATELEATCQRHLKSPSLVRKATSLAVQSTVL